MMLKDACGQDYTRATIERFSEYIKDAYLRGRYRVNGERR